MRPLSASCALSDQECGDCTGNAVKRGHVVRCRHVCHLAVVTPVATPKKFRDIMADALAAKGKR